MNREKFGLNERTISLLKSTLQKWPEISKILIYGSRAKGNFRKGSDIDICLVAPQLGTTDLLKIENDIEELMLPYKIDISFFHLIENNDLKNHIDRIGVEL